MRCHRFSSSPPLPLHLFSVLVMVAIPVSLSTPELYTNCSNAVFKCGNITAGYPFSGGDREKSCGHSGLQLYCQNQTPKIEILDIEYQVLEIDQVRQILTIARDDLIKYGFCGPSGHPYSALDSNLFEFVNATGLGYINITLFYDCQPSFLWHLGFFSCDVTAEIGFSIYNNVSMMIENTPLEGCLANVTVPILHTSLEGIGNNSLRLEDTLKTGFEVKWKLEDREACRKCRDTDGTCGFDDNNQPVCYCSFPIPNWEEAEDCSPPPPPPSAGSSNWKLNLIIGFTVAAAAVIAVVCIVPFIVPRIKGESLSNRNSIHLQLRKMNNNAKIESFITKYGSLAPKPYVYTDIKKMTNKFKEKLGQGGYGSVYKGKLPDGRLVAVKVLSESKGNGEEFMNEVASISRTSHVNIVPLLGFCYRSKRALIYEFMPHGSLDKFIYNQGSLNQSRQLEWKTLYDISLGIARGLEYLHQGCNTRILHFDIKPHNILLDENFCPKISDFGLSKLCERKESIISMIGARGTAGYIAPEVFCRNFGGVSDKSDVYSYGMMVLEMIGGRKNIDIGVSKTSEIYFPSWIHKHLDQAMNMNLHGVTTKEEEEITSKLIVVSLWCIQTIPSDRPSMTKVLEMLQGSLQSLVIPPRPVVSSPLRSP